MDAVLEAALGYLIKAHPWISRFIPEIIILIVAVIAVAALWKSRTATDHSIFFGLYKWKTDAPVYKLNETLNQVLRDSEIKTNTLFLAKLFALELVEVFVNPTADITKEASMAVLYGLQNALRSTSQHRSAVLVPDESGHFLRMLHGVGYSPQSQKEFRLNITSSCAGTAFRTGEHYYCRDKDTDDKWTKLPKSQHQYRSILCIPIKSGQRVLAVLNVDAVEANAFHTDDIATLELFAANLAVLLEIEEMVYSSQEVAANDSIPDQKA